MIFSGVEALRVKRIVLKDVCIKISLVTIYAVERYVSFQERAEKILIP